MMQRLRTAGREAIWVLLAALVLATVVYLRHPGILQNISAGTDSPSGFEESLLPLSAAADHHRKGTAVFVDARPEALYQAGHIDGALNFEPDQFDNWADAVFSEIPADAVIITYCDGERCTLSTDLVEKLTWLGYEKVYHLKNGWSRWKEDGLPTVESPR